MESLYGIQLIKIKKDVSLLTRRGKTSAFIICENTTDEDLIDKFASSLSEVGCSEVYFHGKQEALWHCIFDDKCINSGVFMLTIRLNRINDCIWDLNAAVANNDGDKTIYLFYDDDEIFNKVINGLMDKKRICPLVGYQNIDSDTCLEYGMVADKMITPSWLPEQIKKKENFREICLECKYHDVDNNRSRKPDMTKPKAEVVLDMLEMLFNGEYEPFAFSLDFPDFCDEYYEELEAACEGLGDYLDEAADICEEGEPGFNPTRMIGRLKPVYRMAKRKIERGGKILPLDKVKIEVAYRSTIKTNNSTVEEGFLPNSISIDINDTLVVNRLDETIEYHRNVFAGNQISLKYHMDFYIETLLECLDARDLFYEVGKAVETVDNEDDVIHTYKITVEAEGIEPRVIEGRYCADELPEDYEKFIRLILKAFKLHGLLGDIFNREFYKKRLRKREELIFCAVEFEEDGRRYHYITDDDAIEEGDAVFVPCGRNHQTAEAVVVKKIYCTEETAPYPRSKVKKIIGKVKVNDDLI